MRVRRAEPADAEAIALAHVRAWQVAYDGLFPEDELAQLDPVARAETLRRRLAAPAAGHATLAAEGDDGVIGFVSTGPSRDDDASRRVGELYAIYVDPTAWGLGAGRQLMDAALDELGATFAEATLWVLAENPRARRFYEAAGWRPDGAEKEDTYLRTPVTEVRYRISLARSGRPEATSR